MGTCSCFHSDLRKVQHHSVILYVFDESLVERVDSRMIRKYIHTKTERSWCGLELVRMEEQISFRYKAFECGIDNTATKLRSVVIPHRQQLDIDFRFMHDNARAHNAGLVTHMFREYDITEWPA